MRVVRFYQSSSPLPPLPLLLLLFSSSSSSPCLLDYRTSTASCRSQWAIPQPRDLNCTFMIAVGNTEPQQQAPDRSGHYRTSTASARSQWAGPQQPAPDRSGHCWTSTASSGSQWGRPDLNSKHQIAVGNAEPQQHVPDSQWAPQRQVPGENFITVAWMVPRRTWKGIANSIGVCGPALRDNQATAKPSYR